VQRIPVLYLAPWVDVGGSDTGTIDWFRFLDRDRFALSLITTQPSANRRLREVVPYAEEVWDLPDLMQGNEFARFILTFVHTRAIKVLHIMNSRLGFELLPDLAGLPQPPRVVVQLHVEEPDRSGYVRYVTTRYGNLVDAYSVSSRHLSDRLGEYDVPQAKRRLIRTGVDAQRDFSPHRVEAIEGLDPDRLQILFPARLTGQKDPLLMVEVAARLRDTGLAYRIHVLGAGDLTHALRERIGVHGLQDEVVMHGECVDIAPWYAACDVVLLTSRFEGVPYVAYEAMAMGTPIVAPDLPGVGELVTPGTGVLVAPRQDPDGYAAAIVALAAEPARRKAMGAASRERACSELSLEAMAAAHGSLYEQLLESGSSGGLAHKPTLRVWQPPNAALRSRRPRASPLVSVVVPCFNHGLYLETCLQSISEQTYAPIETIVVDDGSTDPGTLEALVRIEAKGTVTLLRLPTNRGPSAARNAAIERAAGRYVLPVDADNLLLPGAVANLVQQLASAGERIGFVYPNCQFFGNRDDYYEPPSYNLHALLAANQCDTSSLIDREVFDRGFRYPEEIVLGHEDWDFVLSLAEHGIYGEPARAKTLLYRKQGFTRSDLIDDGNVAFAGVVAERHPGLFDLRRRAQLKAHWTPAVSVIALDALLEGADEALDRLVSTAARQTCQDFELVIQTVDDAFPTALGARLRRVPSSAASSRARALVGGAEIARGRYVLATYGSVAALLADPALIEKLLRVLEVSTDVHALALAQSSSAVPPFRLLAADQAGTASLVAFCWEALEATAPPASLQLADHQPLETLARWLSVHTMVQWRHLPRRERPAIAVDGEGLAGGLAAPRLRRARDAHLRATARPQLPELPPGFANRIARRGAWTPPQSRVLCRHVHLASERYLFTNDRTPPGGWGLQYDLGAVRSVPLAGTTSLLVRSNGGESAFACGEQTALDAPELLGFVEQAPLPLFDPLQVARHRVTGQRVLIAGAEDPLAQMVDEVRSIGYIEPFPIHPRRPPHIEVQYGVVGLLRAVDLDARCHRYGVGEAPRGRLAGELGALFTKPTGDCEPLWIDEAGRVRWPRSGARDAHPSPRAALCWSVAPLRWREAGPVAPRLRATTRRALQSARILSSRAAELPSPASTPAGYLLRSATDRTLPLYAAVHPITGDQLLSNGEAEPRALGYEDVALLGHLIAHAPVTGRLEVISPPVPWASRFGLGSGGR